MRVGLKCSTPASMSETSVSGKAGISAGEWMTKVEAKEEAGEEGISAGEGMTRVEANEAGISMSHKGGCNSAGISAGEGMTKVEAHEAGLSMSRPGERNSMSLLATRDTGDEHGLSRTSMMIEWESFRFDAKLLEAMSKH
jgi:hypothetical protein